MGNQKSVLTDEKYETIFADTKAASLSGLTEQAIRAKALERVRVYDSKEKRIYTTTRLENAIDKMFDNLESSDVRVSTQAVLDIKKLLGEDKQVVETTVVGSEFFLGIGKDDKS